MDFTSFPLPSAGKVAAAKALIELGCHPLLLHGVVDGVCTCAKAAECGRSAGKHPVESGWQKAELDADALLSRLEKAPTLNIGWRMGLQPNGDRIVAIDDDGGLSSNDVALCFMLILRIELATAARSRDAPSCSG